MIQVRADRQVPLVPWVSKETRVVPDQRVIKVQQDQQARRGRKESWDLPEGLEQLDH